MRPTRILAVAVGISAIAVVVCASAAADREKVRLVATDQSLARNALVRLDDLGDPTGWSGGSIRATPPTSFTCGSYTAKQSDLVLTGNAAAKWLHRGLEIDSQAQVLRSRGMVELDWQRTVTHAGTVDCLRRQFASGLPSGQKLVSFGQIAFPKVGRLSAAYRGVVDVSGSGSTVRLIVDLVVVGAGRVELTLITTAPYEARGPVQTAEARIVQAMAARAQPGAA